MGAEIPVWVGGLQKWITGLTKKTTCEEIVRALLRAEGRPLVEEQDWTHYVIVERWRKVERPLDAKAKIWKVWKTWGEEQGEVKFTLKRIPSTPPKDVKTVRKRPNSKFWRQGGAKTTTTLHPRKLLQQHQHTKTGGKDVDGRITETMERLMKVIIAQGETIQAQLRRLEEKDDQIDCFEQQMHVMRMEEMGANYLLDTYLGDGAHYTPLPDGSATVAPPGAGPEPAQKMSAMDADDGDTTVRNLRRCARYYERFLEINETLEKEEEAVAWLTSQIRLRQEATSLDDAEHDDLLLEVQAAHGSLQRLVAINAAKDAEIEENDAALMDIRRLMEDKGCYMMHLEEDLSATDEDNEKLRLQHEALANCSTKVSMAPDGVPIRIKDPNNDTDSNSDTGLSSLHSSSDEGVYALDTLV